MTDEESPKASEAKPKPVARRRTKQVEERGEAVAVSIPAKRRLTIPLPRFTFRHSPANGFLVLGVVIFAFTTGMLLNKVLFLEKELKNRPAEAAIAAEPTIPPPPEFVKVENGKLPVLGNKDAKITMVEFSDLQCPFCKRYFDDAHKQVLEKYIKTGKVKLYYRHYPLSFHPNAQKAGEASECANEQGKFWEYHDILFNKQDTWSPQSAADAATTFSDIAGELDLNITQFSECLSTGKYEKAVKEDFDAGNQAQVDGTPSFFFNGHRLVGALPFSEFERIIEEELKK